MATVKLGAYNNSTTVLGVELNNLTTGYLSAVGATVLDNTGNLYLYSDFELLALYGSGPTIGASLDLYATGNINGLYEISVASGTTLPPFTKKVGSFVIPTTGTSQRLQIYRVPLISGKMQFQLVNNGGQNLASLSSVVVAYTYPLTVA